MNLVIEDYIQELGITDEKAVLYLRERLLAVYESKKKNKLRQSIKLEETYFHKLESNYFKKVLPQPPKSSVSMLSQMIKSELNSKPWQRANTYHWRILTDPSYE